MGSDPETSVKTLAGLPDAVKVKLPASPTVKVAWFTLVKAGEVGD